MTPYDLQPTAWFRAEESSVINGVFTALDLSGNDLHARQPSAARAPQRVRNPQGLSSWAWVFDGVDDYLQATDVTSAQLAQTVIALARLTGSSTTRRAWGFGAFYSLFANGAQWGYYAQSNDTIRNLGGATANWSVVAIRQHTNSVATRRLVCTGMLPVSFPPLDFVSESQWQTPTWTPDPANSRDLLATLQANYEPNRHLLIFTSRSWQNPEDQIVAIYQAIADQPLAAFSLYETEEESIWPYDVYVANAESAGARASINGGSVIGPWTPKSIATTPLAIGAEGWNTNNGVGAQLWPGMIAEVQVYQQLLTNDEVAALYERYFVPRYFHTGPTGPVGRIGIGDMRLF